MPEDTVQRVLAQMGRLVKDDTACRSMHCRLPKLLLLARGGAGQELWISEMLSTGTHLQSRGYIWATS